MHKPDSMSPAKKKQYVEERLKALGATSGPSEVLQRLVHNRALFCVYLLIDCSASMRGFKLAQAKAGSIHFAENAFRKGYAVGAISFSSDARMVSEPVQDVNQLRQPIARLEVGGSTNLTRALFFAREKLPVPVAGGTIVVATDGEPDNPASAVKMAQELRANGIDIICIGTDNADQHFLEQIASRKELAVHVRKEQLASAISDAAKQLSGGGTPDDRQD